MIQMKKNSPEVYVADQPIVAIGREEIDFLQSNVQSTERKRTRLCAHQSPEEGLHEMFVVYTSSTYMRPNKHPKDESLHILKGYADFVFFDQQGNVTEVLQLGEPSSGRPFYCRVPQDTYHTVLMRSELLVIHEGLTGPFRRDSTTVFAPWAPLEDDMPGVRAFSERIDADVARRVAANQPALLRVVRQSPEVFISDEPVGKFGQREMDLLREALPHAPRRRVRICMHKGVEDRYHEMFIMFSKGSYLAASKHLGKDESVDVVEGKADLVLFDEAGEITNVISVGDPSTGLPFYFRTPRERYHAWIVRSDVFAVHETTEGPFRREDTIFAPWSPGDVNDPVAVPIYQEQLEQQTARFMEKQPG
jgi:cupin fold WbuC family metalloprotein